MQRFKSFLAEKAKPELHIHLHPEDGSDIHYNAAQLASRGLADNRTTELSQLSRSLGNTAKGPSSSPPQRFQDTVSKMRPSDNVQDWRTPYSNSPLYNEGGKKQPHIHPEGGDDWKAGVRDKLQQGLQGGTPDHPSFMPGGMTAGTNKLAAALRFGNRIFGAKPGEAHSSLGHYADELGKKPDDMGFVGKPSGSGEGEHGGMFFPRDKAAEIGRRHPDLVTDPETAVDPHWKYAQSYDFKPEGGKWNPAPTNPNPIQSPDASTYAQRGKDIYQSSRELKQNPQDYLQKRGVPQQTAPKPPSTSIGPDSEGGKKRAEGGPIRDMAQKALQGGTSDHPSFIPGAGNIGRFASTMQGMGKVVQNAPKPEPTTKPIEKYTTQQSKPGSLGSTIRDPQGNETGSMWGMQHPTKPNELHLGGIENAPVGAVAGEQGPGQHLGAGTLRAMMRDWAAKNKQPGQDTLSMTRTSGANPGDPYAPGMGREVKLPLDKLEGEGGPEEPSSIWDKVGQGFQKLGFPKPGPDAGTVRWSGKTPPGNVPKPTDLGQKPTSITSDKPKFEGGPDALSKYVLSKYGSADASASTQPKEPNLYDPNPIPSSLPPVKNLEPDKPSYSKRHMDALNQAFTYKAPPDARQSSNVEDRRFTAPSEPSSQQRYGDISHTLSQEPFKSQMQGSLGTQSGQIPFRPEGGKKPTPNPFAFPRSDSASNPPTESGNKKRKEGGDEKEVMIPGKGFSSSVSSMRPSSNIDDKRDFMDKSQAKIVGAINKKFGSSFTPAIPLQQATGTKAVLSPWNFEGGKKRAEGGQNLSDADRKNMPSPVYNQGSEYGWEPTAQIRMSQATRSMGHTGQPIDLSGPRSPGPPSTSFTTSPSDPWHDTPKFTPSAIAPYRTRPDFDMTQSFRHSDNVIDRRGQIKPGYDVTPQLGMAHAGVNKAGETRQGSPGTQSGEMPEGGKKRQPSHEHGGMLFYGPHEK